MHLLVKKYSPRSNDHESLRVSFWSRDIPTRFL